MHSSRMRTGRSLTVCCRLLPGGGGFSLPGGGFSLPGGVLPAGGGSAWSRGGSPCQGEVSAWSRGGSPCWGGLPGLEGVSAWSRGGGSPCRGGVCLVPGGSPCRGVCLVRGGVLPVGGGWPETPPVNRITDTCKNITLATTSLRPVKIKVEIFGKFMQSLVASITISGRQA